MADRVTSLFRTVLHPVLSTLRLQAGRERLPVSPHHAVPAVQLSGVILARPTSASTQMAEAMYGGVYAFAGTSVTALPDTVFSSSAASASAAWKAELRRMDWLSSFRASARPLHGLLALRLLAGWMKQPPPRQSRAGQIATLFNLAVDAPAIAAAQSPAAVALAAAAILRAQVPVLRMKPATPAEAFARALALLAAHLATRSSDNQRLRIVAELADALDALLHGDGSLRDGTIDDLVQLQGELAAVMEGLERAEDIISPQLLSLRNRINAYLSLLSRTDGTLAFAEAAGLRSHVPLQALRESALAADAGHARLVGTQTLAFLALSSPRQSVPLRMEVTDAGRPLLWLEQVQAAGAMNGLSSTLICAAGGSLAEVQGPVGDGQRQHLAIFLSGDGSDLRVEDISPGPCAVSYLLHVPEQTRLSTTHHGTAAMIVPASGTAWQLLVRAGSVELESGCFRIVAEAGSSHPLNFALKRVSRQDRPARPGKQRGRESAAPRLL